jgi:hypothetical protein
MAKSKQPVAKQQALNNMEAAIKLCEASGIKVSIAPLYRDGDTRTVVILLNVDIKDGHLVALDTKQIKE